MELPTLTKALQKQLAVSSQKIHSIGITPLVHQVPLSLSSHYLATC
jgi:hypothetical protein